MTYELAKQLWEAHYPMTFGNSQTYQEKDGAVSYPNPTLSELIEACGKDFIRLEHSGTSWAAFGQMHRYEDKISDTMQCGGATPEEAVARLWLALNQRPKDAVT